jgi:OPA family glycerol-3-phosphate transporter-like MFS transporter
MNPIEGSPEESTRRKRWQTLTLCLLVCGYAGYYFCRSNLSVTLPLLIAELGLRGMPPDAARVALGSVASLGVLAYAIGKFPSGGLADFLGGRRNFLFGMAGAVAFTLIFALSGTIPVFTLAWMGNRLVQSLGWAGMVKMTSKWFSFRRYGTVMAIISLSYLFGDAVARQFMAVLIQQGLGWRGVFGATAAVLVALLLLCLFFLRESPRDIGELPPAANPFNLFAQDGEREKPASIGALLQPFLKSGVFWLACGLSLGTTILRETFGLWTPTYFTQAAGMSAAEAAAKSALFPLAGGVSVIVCGWMSDRLGRGGRAAVLFAGLLLATFALLTLGFGVVTGSAFGPVALVAIVAFLIIGPYSFLGGAISLDFGGKQGSGTASGIIDGIGYLGGVVSGDSMARISVAHGWSGAFLVLAGVAAASSAGAAVFLYYERRFALSTSKSSATVQIA